MLSKARLSVGKAMKGKEKQRKSDESNGSAKEWHRDDTPGAAKEWQSDDLPGEARKKCIKKEEES